jgi:ribosome modulation factor
MHVKIILGRAVTQRYHAGGTEKNSGLCPYGLQAVIELR